METLGELEARRNELLNERKELSNNIIGLPLNATEKQISAWRKSQLRKNVIDEQIAEVGRRIAELGTKTEVEVVKGNGKTKQTRKVMTTVVVVGVLVVAAVAGATVYVVNKLGIKTNKVNTDEDTPSITDTTTVVEEAPVEIGLSGKVTNDANDAINRLSILAKENVDILTSEEVNLVTLKCSELTEALKGTDDIVVIALTNEVNEIANDIQTRIDAIKADAEEEQKCIDLAKDYYKRIEANNWGKHNSSITYEETLQFVKWIRKHVGPEEDQYVVTAKIEDFMIEANNTAAGANYSKGLVATPYDTAAIMEGVYSEDEILVVKVIEDLKFKYFNAKSEDEKKAISNQVRDLYTHYFLKYQENVITIGDKTYTFKGHDSLSGFTQLLITWDAIPLLDLYNRKTNVDVQWQPNYVLAVTSDDQMRTACERYMQEYNDAVEPRISWKIFAELNMQKELEALIREANKNIGKSKSLVLENK